MSPKPALKKQSNVCMGDAIPEHLCKEDTGQTLTEINNLFLQSGCGYSCQAKSDSTEPALLFPFRPETPFLEESD